MELLLPNFSDFLDEISVCAILHADSPSRLNWFEKPIQFQAECPLEGDSCWIRLVIEHDDGTHGHLHFDIGRDKDDDSVLAIVPFSEIQENVNHFEGQKVQGYLSASYSIPLDRLPRHGMLSALLGVSTNSCGAHLSLAGARMNIDGDTCTRLRWEYDEEKECVYVKLDAETQPNIGPAYLTDAIETMRHGIECFVLETDESKLSNDNSRNVPKSAQA